MRKHARNMYEALFEYSSTKKAILFAGILTEISGLARCKHDFANLHVSQFMLPDVLRSSLTWRSIFCKYSRSYGGRA